MSENKLAIIGIIVFMLVQFGFFWATKDSMKGHTITYDCSISEISPDFPIEVREQCRKLKAKYSNGRV